MKEIAHTYELLSKAQGGDRAAAETLLAGYKQLVTGVARKYYLVGGDADDISQEGMIGLYKAVMNYDPERNDSFIPYATLSIHRQIQTAVKIANRDKNKPVSEGVDLEHALTDKRAFSPGAEDEFLQREEYGSLSRAILSLGQEEQSILKYYLDGKSYAVIGECLGLSSKKIDNTLQAIKKKLRSQLAKE